ncbi:hypothetical protein JXO52_11005 [bacterium]|nr:hypothetical protein [bacterium]
MAVCDICNIPGWGIPVSASVFRTAVQNGFCPFRLHLDNDMGIPNIRDTWRREALASHTDWNLCATCHSALQPYI